MQAFVDAAALGFIRSTAAKDDPVLAGIRSSVERQGLPSITPEAGRTLQLVARMLDAERVLEVGTCLGYSAVWMARSLAVGGVLETIEVDGDRAREARRWFHEAGLAQSVDVLEGEAARILPSLKDELYDLVFLDADKEGMPEYLRHAKRLVRRGGVIAADNVFWQGSTFPGAAQVDGTREVSEFVRMATTDPGLLATILPLGDGLLVALKL
ncbi:MAG: O-methyltransferase [Methanobacteriota archaeon]